MRAAARPYSFVMEKNREKFDTAFWQKAYDSLPPQARGRHARLLRAAERWELKLDAALQAWTRR